MEGEVEEMEAVIWTSRDAQMWGTAPTSRDEGFRWKQTLDETILVGSASITSDLTTQCESSGTRFRKDY